MSDDPTPKELVECIFSERRVDLSMVLEGIRRGGMEGIDPERVLQTMEKRIRKGLGNGDSLHGAFDILKECDAPDDFGKDIVDDVNQAMRKYGNVIGAHSLGELSKFQGSRDDVIAEVKINAPSGGVSQSTIEKVADNRAALGKLRSKGAGDTPDIWDLLNATTHSAENYWITRYDMWGMFPDHIGRTDGNARVLLSDVSRATRGHVTDAQRASISLATAFATDEKISYRRRADPVGINMIDGRDPFNDDTIGKIEEVAGILNMKVNRLRQKQRET